MKAPEKLYVNIHDHLTQKGYYAFTNKVTEDDIEYVCKNAFIEKAENYLRNKCQRFILTEKDIEDFVKYMKGE